jgi:hypothetical protein
MQPFSIEPFCVTVPYKCFEVGTAEVGIAEVGIAEVGIAEVGIAVSNFKAF